MVGGKIFSFLILSGRAKAAFDSSRNSLLYFLQAVELQKLILAHNNLEVLNEDLKTLNMLTVLNVSHNKLSSLPIAIGEYV